MWNGFGGLLLLLLLLVLHTVKYNSSRSRLFVFFYYTEDWLANSIENIGRYALSEMNTIKLVLNACFIRLYDFHVPIY